MEKGWMKDETFHIFEYTSNIRYIMIYNETHKSSLNKY